MPKNYYCDVEYGEDAHKKILQAARKIGKTVTQTLGPKGSHVVLDRPGCPVITKDGVTVFYDLDNFGDLSSDKIELMVYEMLRTVTDEINATIGDGTTSMVLLTWQMMENLYKYMASGFNRKKLKLGFQEAINQIRENIEEYIVEANDEDSIKASLHVSANGEKEIINTLTEVFLDAGDESMIFIRKPKGVTTEVTFTEGLTLPTRTDTPSIIPANGRLYWDDVPVLLISEYITDPSMLVDVLEDIATHTNHKNIVLGYNRMEDSVKSWIRRNNNETDMKIFLFKVPMNAERQIEWMEDIAALTDAQIGGNDPLKPSWCAVDKLGKEQLGRVTEFQADLYGIKFIGGQGTQTINDETGNTRLEDRLEEMTKERDRFTGNEHERTRMNEHVAALSGSIVSIHPGGMTEPEVKRKTGVYEDALMAGQTALKGGVVPGAGWSMYKAALELPLDNIEDFEIKAGAVAAVNAVQCIFKKICHDYQILPRKVCKLIGGDSKHLIYNFQKNRVGNMIEERLVDPWIMVDFLLEKAAGIASVYIDIEATLIRKATDEFVSWKKRHQQLKQLRY